MAGVGGAVFGFAGGEYSTVDWWKLRQSVQQAEEAVARLRVEIDSLTEEVVALETDPATQERVAREAFGMLRPGEMLYRVERGEGRREREE